MKSFTFDMDQLEGRDCPAANWTTSWSWAWTWTPSQGMTTTVRTNQPNNAAATDRISLARPAAPKATPAKVADNVLGDRVATFVQSRVGQVVAGPNATGCAALASAAIAAAGAKPPVWNTSGPISDHYVWGRAVYRQSTVAGYAALGSLAGIRPGDIIQMDGYREDRPDGSWMSAGHHTAVVESVDAATGRINVIHQNWNGNQAAHRAEFQPGTMTSGVFTVYRPTAA